jgi:putative (di)nucleoside polyphosphate hydrolase|tara:strand:- start:72 stop:542 length:471 start_codon:yes stop_codon:yes gene_type:complete
MKNKLLPLRIGVGAIILNNENKVLVGKRKDNPIDKWQMPQGGVEKNEDYVDAMKRELFEETSVTSIKILKEFDEWLEYELPNNLVGIIWKGKFRGQKQKWFISRFTGNDSEINIKTNHPEFIDWKWVEMNELPNIIVDFKKDIYKKILIKLREFIN